MKFYGKEGPIDIEIDVGKDLDEIKKAQEMLFEHPYIDCCIIYSRHGKGDLQFMYYKISAWGFQICGIHNSENVCSQIFKNGGI